MIPAPDESRPEIRALRRRHGVRRLEFFGPTALGEDYPGKKGLSFLVQFEPEPPGGYPDAYFGLLESLEMLLGRPVDLVVSSAIRNPYFLQLVERTKTLLCSLK